MTGRAEDPSIVIEEFGVADYEAVMALWRGCEGIGLSAADERAPIAAYLARNPRMSFVAREGTAVVGAVLCGHDGRRGYLHHLAVAAHRRRRGIGRRLVDHCLEALAAAGIQKCHLFLYADNAAGAAFWRRLGWTPRRDIRVVSKVL